MKRRYIDSYTYRKIDSTFIIFLFWLGILLPLFDNALDIDPGKPIEEKRALSVKPPIRCNWSMIYDFPPSFEKYYRDHLGFRDSLIRWYNWEHIKVLNTSPLPRVVLGRDGWLYLGGSAIDYYRGTSPVTRVGIARIARILEERRHWLAEQNIPLLYIFTPIKSSIYPEYLPAGLSRVHHDTTLDCLIAYLEKYTEFEFLDLRDTLIHEKNDACIYFKTGTHWNSYGAYLAYRRIIEYLSEKYFALQPLQKDDVIFRRELIKGCDLAQMLGLEDMLREDTLSVSPANPAAAESCNVPLKKEYYPFKPHFAMEIPNSQLPRVVMFRDSFADYLIPFMSENFRRIAYIYQPEFDTGVIHKEQPNLVMHQLAERSFIEPWPLNPLEISHSYLREKFDSSRNVRFDIKHTQDMERIRISGHVTALTYPDKMSVSFHDETAEIIVPVNGHEPLSLLIVKAAIDIPEDTTLHVRYNIKLRGKWMGEKFFTDYLKDLFKLNIPETRYVMKEESFQVVIKRGRNDYYVPIDAPNLEGPVRLQIGSLNKEIEIFDLEIRNLPYPHEVKD